MAELRTLADAAALRARLARTRQAIVIGGGFIGLEFAAMARAAGVGMTVLEATPRLMGRALSPEMSADFLDAHRIGSKDGRITGVDTADLRIVEGNLVLIACGVRPNVELAEAAGLHVDNGIVLDETLATSDPAISALGDAASFPLPDGSRARLESVQAAVDHARHIARRLVKGAKAAYAAVPCSGATRGR